MSDEPAEAGADDDEVHQVHDEADRADPTAQSSGVMP